MTTKRLLPSLLTELVFFIELATNKKSEYLFPFFFWCFDFYFWYACLNNFFAFSRTTGTTLYVLLKEKNQAIVKQGMLPYYVFIYEEQLKNISCSYQSLTFWEKKSLSKGKILGNKGLMKLWINQNFCL